MIDVKRPLRKAYYDLLNGFLLYNGVGVPVSDDLKKLQDAGTNIYVLISVQSGSDNRTMQSWDSDEDVSLDIVFKAAARANRQVVDMVADQILQLLFPIPATDGLTDQPGVDISCVRMINDQNLDMTLGVATTMTRRRLTFRQHIRQTLNTNPVNGIKGILNIKSADFTSTTEYKNTDLAGKVFELFSNDVPKFLEHGVDWEYISMGGFRILMENFDASLNNYNIYVLLK